MTRTPATVWSKLGVQRRLTNVSELLTEVATITVATGNRYVWRGVKDAHYGLHTSLDRRLRSSDLPVTATHLRQYETDLVHRARNARLDRSLPRAELLALLQHAGASTSLLDVTP